MALLRSVKLRSATLLEVIVSLVIVMIVFGIAMMIYINVLNSTPTERELNYFLLMKEVSSETISSKRYFNEDINKNGIHIMKSVSKYHGLKDLMHLHLEIADGNRPVSIDQLIMIDNQ